MATNDVYDGYGPGRRSDVRGDQYNNIIDRYDPSTYSNWRDFWTDIRSSRDWAGWGDNLRKRDVRLAAREVWGDQGGASAETQDGRTPEQQADIASKVADVNDLVDQVKEAAAAGYDVDWNNYLPSTEVDAQGNPVQGMAYPVLKDASGNVIRSFEPQFRRLAGLADYDIPSFTDYLSGVGGPHVTGEQYLSQNYDNMDRIIRTLTNGPVEQDKVQASDWFGRIAGIDDADQYVSGLRESLYGAEGGDISDESLVGRQQGFTDEERLLRERAMTNQRRQDEELGSRQLDQVMGQTGSNMRGIAAAEEIRQNIGNADLQRELAMDQEETARKMYEFEQKRDHYQAMVDSGAATREQYLQAVRSDRLAALQGTAAKMNSLAQSYGAELQGIGMYLENQYNSIMTEFGISESVMGFAEQYFNSTLSPLLAQLEAAGIGLTATATDYDIDSYETGA